MKLTDIFNKNPLNPPPFWMMRQAGRYLPEYLELRKQSPDFMKFCFNQESIVEATLQPLRRFNLDAAIIFSDILIIPHVLGQKVTFAKNHGPVLELLDFEKLKATALKNSWQEDLAVVYKAITEVKKQLKDEKDVFGFCGSPWTVACYMLEGKKSNQGEFESVENLLKTNPEKIKEIIDFLTPLLATHLENQQKAGASIVQIFDSWAGYVPKNYQNDFLFDPLRKIISHLREKCGKKFPVMYFGRSISDSYASINDLDAFVGFQVDQSADLVTIREELGLQRVLQGNLDPELLVLGGELLNHRVKEILKSQEGYPFIFNLGHGILPHTPISHVHQVLEVLQSSSQNLAV